MAVLLDGRIIAQAIQARLKDELRLLCARRLRPPVLAVLSIGQEGPGAVYLRVQANAARELGIEYRLLELENGASQACLRRAIDNLNQDEAVSAIMIQAPLPPEMNLVQAAGLILPQKDVEGLGPQNLGRLFYKGAVTVPCTAASVMELLKATRVSLYGKEAVVVGHSEIVGKPLSLLLLGESATTTVCHVATSERGLMREHVGRAEVLIAAVGKPEIIKGSWIKEGAIVIDVGINRVGGRTVGDVEFDEASRRAGFITPVPGGVGPLTVAMLMKNCVELFKVGLKLEKFQITNPKSQTNPNTQ